MRNRRQIIFKNGKVDKILEYIDELDNTREKYINRELKAYIESIYAEYLKGMKLYAFTVTYTPNDEAHSFDKTIKNRFKKFYLHEFLTKIHFNNNEWTKKFNKLQPAVVLFVEDHESKAVTMEDEYGITRTSFPERLHHHGIMAVHPDFVSRLEPYIGVNTLNHLCKGIMTTDFKPCNIEWMLYAGKHFKQDERDRFDSYGHKEALSKIRGKQPSNIASNLKMVHIMTP